MPIILGRREGHLPYGLRRTVARRTETSLTFSDWTYHGCYLFCLVLLIITGIDSASSSHVVPIILEDEKATSLRYSPHLLPYSSRTPAAESSISLQCATMMGYLLCLVLHIIYRDRLSLLQSCSVHHPGKREGRSPREAAPTSFLMFHTSSKSKGQNLNVVARRVTDEFLLFTCEYEY